MCDKSDELYDRSVSSYGSVLGSSSSSGGKLGMHRARRVVVPTRIKGSPYITERVKYLVSATEMHYYNVVVKLGSSDHQL